MCFDSGYGIKPKYLMVEVFTVYCTLEELHGEDAAKSNCKIISDTGSDKIFSRSINTAICSRHAIPIPASTLSLLTGNI